MGYTVLGMGKSRKKQRLGNFDLIQKQFSQIKCIQREDVRITLHSSFSQRTLLCYQLVPFLSSLLQKLCYAHNVGNSFLPNEANKEPNPTQPSSHGRFPILIQC